MYGLVLEGGGAKGAYQIGAYKALRELKIEISGVVGTSIGALNGAMIVQDEYDKLYDLWYNISPSKVFEIDEHRIAELKKLDISHDGLFYFMNKAKEIWLNKGLDITFLKNLLQENIDEKMLRRAKKDFGIITVSLSDMKPMELFIEDIPEGKIIEYLLASAHLPAFKREKMDGKYFLDGGFYDNLPVNLLLRKGYKDIIAVRTGALGRIRKFDESKLNIMYIRPNEDLGSILDFDQKNARKNLKLGYYDTLKVFKGLKGFEYYITPKHDEDFYMNYLIGLGEQRILKVGKLFGITDVPYKRLLFEFIVPRLTNILSMTKENRYEDIVIRLLEIAAKEYKIKRFKIYTFEEFIHAMASKQIKVNAKVPKHMPNFVKKYDVLAKAAKDNILKEVIYELFGENLSLEEEDQ